MLISDRYIRIDGTDEGGGYIIYDDKDKVIYSASHLDQSIMLIKPFKFSSITSTFLGVISEDKRFGQSSSLLRFNELVERPLAGQRPLD